MREKERKVEIDADVTIDALGEQPLGRLVVVWSNRTDGVIQTSHIDRAILKICKGGELCQNEPITVMTLPLK